MISLKWIRWPQMNVTSLDIIDDAAYDIDINSKTEEEEDDITRNERTTQVVMFVYFLTVSYKALKLHNTHCEGCRLGPLVQP